MHGRFSQTGRCGRRVNLTNPLGSVRSRQQHLFRSLPAMPTNELVRRASVDVSHLSPHRLHQFDAQTTRVKEFLKQAQVPETTYEQVDHAVTQCLFWSALVQYAGADVSKARLVRFDDVASLFDFVSRINLGINHLISDADLYLMLSNLPEAQRVGLVIRNSDFTVDQPQDDFWRQAQAITNYDKPYIPQQGYFHIPSFGLMVLQMQLIFGSDAVLPRPVIGPSRMFHIDQAQSVNERDMSLTIPVGNRESYGMINAHGLRMGRYGTSLHDYFHCLGRSMMPESHRDVLNFVKERLYQIVTEERPVHLFWPSWPTGDAALRKGGFTSKAKEYLVGRINFMIDSSLGYYVRAYYEGGSVHVADLIQVLFRELEPEDYEQQRLQSFLIQDMIDHRELWEEAFGVPLEDLTWTKPGQFDSSFFRQIIQLNS